MRIISTLLILGLSVACFSQTTNEVLSAELDEFIQEQMEIQSIPSATCCIVKCDQIVYQSSFGYAHIDDEQLATLETEYTLASISKLFTATACAILWQDGLLDLDADINDYLPSSIINPNHPDQPITTRQLLTHKSSLRDSESDLQLWDQLGDPIYELDYFCEEYFIANGNLYVESNWGLAEPGNAPYWYSNAGFTLLGYIVQEVSEMPFNEYVEQEILEPLNMSTAGWFYSDVDISDVAMPYNADWTPYGYYSVPEYPAAMLKSNILELSNFLKMYAQHGEFNGVEILEQETFELLVPDDLNDGFAWWGQDSWWGDPNGEYWSHGGYMNGVRTQLNYYPTDSTGLIILCNGNINYAAIQDELEEYIPLFECETSNIIEENKVLDISIYPIPAHNSINLEFNTIEKRVLEIFDLKGSLLDQYDTIESKIKIDISNLEAGVYTVRIRDQQGIQVQKLIKQ